VLARHCIRSVRSDPNNHGFFFGPSTGLPQRARAAFRAISFLRSGDSFLLRNATKATAIGFFFFLPFPASFIITVVYLTKASKALGFVLYAFESIDNVFGGVS